MPDSTSNLRGIAFMVLGSGCFTINNALLKLAVVNLPPLESLFLRAVAAIVLGVPVLLAWQAMEGRRALTKAADG